MRHQQRFTAEKIAQRLALIEQTWVYRQRDALAPFRLHRLSGPGDPPPLDDPGGAVVEPYSYWIEPRTDFVLYGEFSVDWEAPVALLLNLGDAVDFSHPEALLYIDGQPVAATDRHHREVLLDPRYCDGRRHTLVLHGWSGQSHPQGERGRLQMGESAVVQINPATREFVILARVALGVANALDAHDPIKGQLLNALDAAFKLLDIREGGDFYASLPAAHASLKEGIAQAGHPLDVTITATGHAHIDVAWLWTLGQTRHKARRTFTTVLRLMEQFPEYHFTQSQPQLYDYIQQDDPALFEAIKQRVQEGRWEPIGGMWVEADCNISGGESLVRQFLLGRAFFRKHFGPEAEAPVLWLPDVFGYAWNLPQLIKEADLEYFFTIKIGWSQYNRLPFDSFWWQGLDGTRVLTHFSTTPEVPDVVGRGTYNAKPDPWAVIRTWQDFQQKEQQRDLLMAFGWGDGGGGPTRDMLENIRAFENFPGAPRMKNGSVAEFFRTMEQKYGDDLPVWNGELYLEIHRGTYTTQARNKRANRQSEFLLHDAEYLATVAALLDESYRYPAETLRQAWELVCLNQFHDIIPGSSITPVYTESLEQYAQVRQMAETARNGALNVIRNYVDESLLVINPSGFSRRDVVHIEETLQANQSLHHDDGRSVMVQPGFSGTWIYAGELPPFSITRLKIKPGMLTRPATGLTVSPTVLKNNYIRVEIDKNGDITRIVDLVHGREVLPEGKIANQWLAFEDRPLMWDAWDIDIFYEDKHWLAEPAESIKVVEYGPLRATVEIKRRILNSPYTQRISLDYNSPRIDIETVIDWREKHILLKAAFPVNVLSPRATYEIQWGSVERPTHQNTSWDWARFETAAQKWVDLSEGDYGVSLLNDGKYGYDIKDNVIRISLLRAPTWPDPTADEGEHRFTYSLLPHNGALDERTIRAAYALNDPLIVVRGKGNGAETHPLLTTSVFSVDQPNVVIETVKQAEDGVGVIVRLYESQRRRGQVRLRTGFKVEMAWQTNILEENREPLQVDDLNDHPGSDITFDIRPYQVVTLRLLRG